MYFPPPSGQSYEIRLLENRKLGDFQDLNTKYVKVGEHSCWRGSTVGLNVWGLGMVPVSGVYCPHKMSRQWTRVEWIMLECALGFLILPSTEPFFPA